MAPEIAPGDEGAEGRLHQAGDSAGCAVELLHQVRGGAGAEGGIQQLADLRFIQGWDAELGVLDVFVPQHGAFGGAAGADEQVTPGRGGTGDEGEHVLGGRVGVVQSVDGHYQRLALRKIHQQIGYRVMEREASAVGCRAGAGEGVSVGIGGAGVDACESRQITAPVHEHLGIAIAVLHRQCPDDLGEGLVGTVPAASAGDVALAGELHTELHRAQHPGASAPQAAADQHHRTATIPDGTAEHFHMLQQIVPAHQCGALPVQGRFAVLFLTSFHQAEHFVGALVAGVGLRIEKLQRKLRQVVGNLHSGWCNRPGIPRAAAHLPADDVLDPIPRERLLPREELIQDHAYRVEIAARVDAACVRFRRRVSVRAPGTAALHVVQRTGETEVQDLHGVGIGGAADHHYVGRLQIGVDHAPAVNEAQPPDEAGHELAALCGSNALGGADEVGALEELHGEILPPVLGGAVVEYPHHVGVAQSE